MFSTVSTYQNTLQSPVIQKDKELIFTLDKIQEESFICILFPKNLKKANTRYQNSAVRVAVEAAY